MNTRPGSKSLRTVGAVAMALVAVAFVAPAWGLYKVVGPDGKVTYTDRPPADAKASAVNGNTSTGSGPALPYELQQIANRFPVTLYTSKDCGACDTGRAYLNQRGVPFSERTITTAADAEAFKRLEGATDVPVLRVGGQRVNGYSEGDWASYLDAAGYPKQSRLPANYRGHVAQPLTTPPATPASAASEAGRSNAPATPAPSGNAPPGFRF